MKITKYFIALVGFCAIIIWASSSSCSNKSVANCNDAASFKAVSKILVTRCSKCHRDSTTAANYGGNYIFEFSNYNLTARDTLNGNPYFNTIDTTAATGTPYNDSTFGGTTMTDILGTSNPQYYHKMPLGGPGLTDCEISSIRTWLLNGAPNN